MGSLVLGMAAERSSRLEDISIETAKTEKQREKRLKKTEYPRMWQLQTGNIHIPGIPE